MLACIRNVQHITFLRKIVPGIRFTGPNGRGTAASVIASAWRMRRAKEETRFLFSLHRAARTIQHAWTSCQNLVETKKAINMVREEEVRIFKELREDLKTRPSNLRNTTGGSQRKPSTGQFRPTRNLEMEWYIKVFLGVHFADNLA